MIELLNYSYPNDLYIIWSLMIVIYPYITGVVAGAFVVSSLYHVFGGKELKPVARFSLLTSFAFLCFAAVPLLNHLGHPERAFNIIFTPNFSSAMAGFGFLLNLYLTIIILEIWFVFRKDIIEMARENRGFKRLFYAVLALGVYDTSEEALKKDDKIIKVLSAIGIPAACLLHGYVGFLFGALKSNPWWSTPLMPIIFLFSAMVSGIAMIIVLYQIIMKFKGWSIDQKCLQSLCNWLWLFLIVTSVLEVLEIVVLAYERAEEWEVISKLIVYKLSFSYISLQMILGALIPFILLMIIVVMSPYLHERVRNSLAMASSLLLLLQVFAMRWNVVIGGQLFSKSLRGFRDYHPAFLGKEGILVAIIILAAPLIVLTILHKILPPFVHLEEEHLG
ncbi:MAG: NrfD/PsrC family molybdoenzyme membrane anchor subunit [Pseudomonadota bacterium]